MTARKDILKLYKAQAKVGWRWRFCSDKTYVCSATTHCENFLRKVSNLTFLQNCFVLTGLVLREYANSGVAEGFRENNKRGDDPGTASERASTGCT